MMVVHGHVRLNDEMGFRRCKPLRFFGCTLDVEVV